MYAIAYVVPQSVVSKRIYIVTSFNVSKRCHYSKN